MLRATAELELDGRADSRHTYCLPAIQSISEPMGLSRQRTLVTSSRGWRQHGGRFCVWQHACQGSSPGRFRNLATPVAFRGLNASRGRVASGRRMICRAYE
jgi:hypothetical protein